MSAEDLLQYVSGGRAGEDAAELERHLLVCKPCRARLLELGRAHRSRTRVRVAGVAASLGAAAVLVVTAVGVFDGGGDVAVVRSDGGTAEFAVVTPTDGTAVSDGPIRFVWHAAGPGAHYVLTLTDDRGDVVWSAEPGDTAVTLPADVVLQAGSTYYWLVDALLDGARSATTGVQELRVR